MFDKFTYRNIVGFAASESYDAILKALVKIAGEIVAHGKGMCVSGLVGVVKRLVQRINFQERTGKQQTNILPVSVSRITYTCIISALSDVSLGMQTHRM
jgi:hypothetical protein